MPELIHAEPGIPKTLSEALVALQAQLPRIPKSDEAQVETKTGRQYSYRYANLATITDLLMPIMSKLGLAWSCMPTLGADGVFSLHYRLTHGPSEETLVGLYPLPATGTPQQIGSAITYARRYALTAITGIAPADDDDDAAAAEKAAQTDIDRDAAGLMTALQTKEHEKLRKLDHPRAAERGIPTTDPWAGQPAGAWEDVTPEDRPGSSIPRQHKVLYSLYTKRGMTDKPAIYADLTDRTGRAITSARDLSFLEADRAVKELSDLVNGDV